MSRYRIIGSILSAAVLMGGTWSMAQAPATPTMTKSADDTITLSDATPGAVILYTLDGKDPTKRSGPYLAPVELPHGGTLEARAFTKDRKEKSETIVAKVAPLPDQKPIPSTLVEVTQDRSWPHYDWAKRHEAVCRALKQMHPQVVFIGDSIIHFWGGPPLGTERRTGQQVWDQNYAKYNAVDMGFGWDRTENVLWRLDHGELDAQAPKVAVVMIGTNDISIKDSPSDIAAGVTAICQKVHQRWPETKILLLAIFPRGHQPNAMRDAITETNKQIAKLDGQDGITYLDIGNHFLEPDGTILKTTMSDYLHPTAKGYEIWVKAMAPTLDKLLGEK